MLKYFGYEMSNKGKSSGSRIIFKMKQKKQLCYTSLILVTFLKCML